MRRKSNTPMSPGGHITGDFGQGGSPQKQQAFYRNNIVGCLLLPSKIDMIDLRRPTTFNFLTKAKSRRVSMDAGEELVFGNPDGQQKDDPKIME